MLIIASPFETSLLAIIFLSPAITIASLRIIPKTGAFDILSSMSSLIANCFVAVILLEAYGTHCFLSWEFKPNASLITSRFCSAKIFDLMVTAPRTSSLR